MVLAVIGCLSFLSLGQAPPLAGAAVVSQTLPTDLIRAADLPLPGVVVPTDGRLRGQYFTATVTGVAWPASLSVGAVPTQAPPGDRLLAFTLRLSEPGELAYAAGSATAAAVSLDVNGDQLSVPLTGITEQIGDHSGGEEPGTGTGTFAVSLPDNDHDVLLVVSQASFTQRFDLWTLKRLPPAPAILYRDPTASSVTASVRGSTELTITNPTTGFVTHAKVALTAATLGYFAPDGSGANPAKPTEAFLSVTLQGTYTDSTHSYEDYLGGSPVPGTELTFTPAGGSPVEATTSPDQNAGHQGLDNGFFNAYYWFTVPAGVTTGTLTINGGPVTGSQYMTLAPTGTTQLTFAQAQIPVTFPNPPPAPAAQQKPYWIGAPVPTVSDGAITTKLRGTASGGFPIWLAVVLILLVAGATVVAERVVRRRRMAVAAASGPVTVAAPTAPSDDPVSSTAGPGLPGTRLAGSSPRITAPTVPPPLGGPDDLVVRVLGPVEVTGWAASPERRGLLEELCCYLALHPGRAFTTAELLGALWPVGGDRGEATPKTLHNYLSRLRQAVGPDRLPDAVTSGGYRLDHVVTDWAEFSRLTGEAVLAAGVEADRLRSQALAQVRGAPMAGAQGTQFGWAFSSALVSTMAVAITGCAHQLSTARLAAGDPVGAEDAARQGLRAVSEDEELWLDAATAARAGGDPARESRLWRDLAAALGSVRARELRQQAGDPPVH